MGKIIGKEKMNTIIGAHQSTLRTKQIRVVGKSDISIKKSFKVLSFF